MRKRVKVAGSRWKLHSDYTSRSVKVKSRFPFSLSFRKLFNKLSKSHLEKPEKQNPCHQEGQIKNHQLWPVK